MKNIFKFILTICLFFTTIYAENINECKTDIYFGNGVWNNSDDTKESIKRFQKIIDKQIINGDSLLKAKYGKVKLQYNWSHGKMIDVLETFYQLKEAGQISEEWFFTFIDELMAKQISDITDEDVKSLREQIINLIISTEENEVDKMLVKYYEESFKYGHKVLLVSHSQGNLFANRVHEKITPSQYQNYFANLQVASPASEVKASKGDYVTGFIDPVINPIPGSMSSNSNLDFPGGHKFVEAYLASEDSLIKITTKIQQLLTSLDAEPSQWETDQELNKNTKEYRITVKHRFDTSITAMNGIEVYPFAPSKKLYYIQGEFSENISGYVKASCGGYKILDADIEPWANKQANEIYYLDGTGEKIKYLKTTARIYIDMSVSETVGVIIYQMWDISVYGNAIIIAQGTHSIPFYEYIGTPYPSAIGLASANSYWGTLDASMANAVSETRFVWTVGETPTYYSEAYIYNIYLEIKSAVTAKALSNGWIIP